MTAMAKIGASLFLCVSCPLSAQAVMSRQITVQNPATQTVRSDEPQPTPANAATQVASIAPLEQQVRELQDAVAALQTQLQELQARTGSGYVITSQSPSYGLTCERASLTNANDLLSRAYTTSVSQFVQNPYPDGTLVMMWANCRSR